MRRVVTASDTYLHKFGRNDDIDTTSDPEDVWDGGGTYTFVSAANTTSIVSDSSADDAADPVGTGAHTVRVWGLNSSWADIYEDVTLDGTTPVPLSNSFLRVHRVVVLTAGTGETNAGTLTVDINGTDVAAVSPSMGQSLMAIYTTAAGETWEMLEWFVSLSGIVSGSAEMALQMRTDGGAWQTKMIAQVTENSSLQYEYPVPLIVPPKTDIRVRCIEVTASNTSIAATFSMVMI